MNGLCGTYSLSFVANSVSHDVNVDSFLFVTGCPSKNFPRDRMSVKKNGMDSEDNVIISYPL
jgi:hypothetical protein